eukprot:3505556-Amphidinium_carterae.1
MISALRPSNSLKLCASLLTERKAGCQSLCSTLLELCGLVHRAPEKGLNYSASVEIPATMPMKRLSPK